MGDKINKEFEEFQKELERRKTKLKFLTEAKPNDDFYKIIDDISGTKLSDESNR